MLRPDRLLVASLLAFTLPLFAACGGGNGSTGPDDDEDDSGQTVVSVEVSPDTAAASELGETVPFEAEARDANGGGQLGDGTTEDSPTPVEVAGGHTFRHLEAGDAHTCGTTTSGAGYCWGSNQSARLGTGDQEDRSEPARLADPGDLGG